MSDTAWPQGVVTFVLTDIEGSTRLLVRLGSAYPSVLERHRALLRSAWDRHGGVEVSTEGDGCLVAFADPVSAVRACAAAQRAVLDESWPDDAPIRVRMGVHSGIAVPRDGDYVALAVHQAARVMGAAHGGRVLLSNATVALLPDHERRGLVSRGRFRLRDFDEPPELFELVVGDLDDRPLRAEPAQRHNLVQPADRTFGRVRAVDRIALEMESARLVTLTGPGGVGKSRLAGLVAAALADRHADGVWRVPVGDVDLGEPLAVAVARTLAVPIAPGIAAEEALLAQLTGRDVVVFFDDAEHRLDELRSLVTTLVRSLPTLRILATSREPLRVPGERLWPVRPLAVPAADAEPDEVAETSSVRLFLDRARAVMPELVPDDAMLQTVAGICRRLDGLPLAIELAAAHAAHLDIATIDARLDDGFDLLRARTPVAERHTTLDAVVRWSVDALGERERVAFRRLGLLRGAFDLDLAVEAIGDVGDADPYELLFALIDRSLVVVEPSAGSTRYRLLEIIGSYARRLLEEAGETGVTASRVARALLDRVGPWFPTDRAWRSRMADELITVKAVLDVVREPELAHALAVALGRYRDVTFAYRTGIEELARVVGAVPAEGPELVPLLATLADLHLRIDEIGEARRLLDRAMAVRAVHGGPPWDDVGVERSLAEIARRSGDLERAADIARSSLETDLTPRGRARMWNVLGTAVAGLGDLDGARDALTAELELNRKAGDETALAASHGNIAEVALRQGDLAGAARHQRACLESATAIGSVPFVAFSAIVAGRLAARRGAWTDGIGLVTAGERLLGETGLALYEDDQREIEALRVAARKAAGAASVDAALEQGTRLTVEEVIDRAHAELGRWESGGSEATVGATDEAGR